MLSTFQSYQLFTRNPIQSAQQVMAEPAVKRAQQYYLANIGKVKTVDDFLNNFQLRTYAATAYGLSDVKDSKAFLRKVLTSDLSDTHSFANALTDTRYKAFAAAFSFDTKGNLKSPAPAAAQAADQTTDIEKLYTAKVGADDVTGQLETQYFSKTIASVKSIDDLFHSNRLLDPQTGDFSSSDTRLIDYVKKAYGIDSTTSDDTIEKALESDVSDPKSFVNQSGDSALKSMAEDFNFAADGTIATQRLAQSTTNFKTMVAAYTAAAGTAGTAQDDAKTESSYMADLMAKATSIDDIVGDSRAVTYIGKAFGMPKITATQLRQVLTSDLDNTKSVANKLSPQTRAIAEAFNFSTTGTISREPNKAAQTHGTIYATIDKYVQQTEETEAGDQNEGVRLALYFQRLAPTITSAYQLLADKALLQFTQTVLGLPAATSNTNIDLQARGITDKIKIADLHDPTKLAKLVQRFTILYDLNNTSNQNVTDAQTLFPVSTG